MNVGGFKGYKLRCELRPELRDHIEDIRRICVCKNDTIATSSKDSNIRIWSLDPHDARRYLLSNILSGHEGFVGPLAWISPDEAYPEGRLVSGGMDKSVIVWNLANGEIVHTLKGHHKMPITGLAVDGECIVSSSADKTLRRLTKDRLESWDAHESSIQAVLKLPSGELVSGSTDQTLKLWKGQASLKTLTGHTGTVRGLAVGPKSGFFSASDDRSIIWWHPPEGSKKMTGHTSAVYSVDFHASSGLLVSGSEDHHAKIWDANGLVQSLEHPSCVWDAKFLKSGDIVTACSDGVARVWTRCDDMVADKTEIDYFETQLSVRVKVGVFWDFFTCPLPNGYHLSKVCTFLSRLVQTINPKYKLDLNVMYLVGDMDTLRVLGAHELQQKGFNVIDAVNRNVLCYSHSLLGLDYIDDERYTVGYKKRKPAPELVLRSLMLREPSVRDIVLITSDYHFLLPMQYLQDEFWCNVMVVKGKDADPGLPSTVIWDDALVYMH